MVMTKTYHTVNGRILGETAAGVRTDYLTDALGSVTATVNASGSVVNRYRYKPYGALLSKTGVGADPKQQWVGSLGYRQTGKKYSDVYVRARHYDTSNGRWMTADSRIWIPTSVRFAPVLLYAYGKLRPTTDTDSSGLDVGRGCLSKPPAACFRCLYAIFTDNTNRPCYDMCPQKACEEASRTCNFHANCGYCGPKGLVKTYGGKMPGPCTDAFAANDYAIWLHNDCGVLLGGHGAGADKLGHCFGCCFSWLCFCDVTGACKKQYHHPTGKYNPDDCSSNRDAFEDNMANDMGHDCVSDILLHSTETDPTAACLKCCQSKIHDLHCQ